MKVREAKEVQGVERAPAPAEKAPTRNAHDRVTVDEAHKAQELVTAAKHHAGHTRAARMQELETALRSGSYRPDAQRIANQILDAAEVDARLRAMMQRGG
jgi:negative regulator of flagellin synthesis FlgM